MILTGVGLWAQDATASPQWVSGTWSLEGGTIRRVSDDERPRARHAGFILPGLVDAHCHIGYSETGAVDADEMARQAALTCATAGCPSTTRACRRWLAPA